MQSLLKKIAIRFFTSIAVIYLIICVLLYWYQESLIFAPDKLPTDFAFQFQEKFEEINIPTTDGAALNTLLFKADSSKGVIFYLHGNAGSLESWGGVAQTYISRGYDVFLLDYRGYGKSSGEISSEAQFFDDAQRAYDVVKSRYAEDKIIVLGYSIGTGAAAMLAANNQPKHLILQAPYYSLVDMMEQHYSFAPTFLLKYRFDIASFLPKIKIPITIFHGDNDSIIDYKASVRLKEFFKSGDKLITLPGGRHNGMTNNPDYLAQFDNLKIW